MANSLKGIKVLVVNTSPSGQNMLFGVLKLLGADVVDKSYEAADGYSAFKKGKHDIIIAELLSGSGDGVTLAKKVRNDFDSPNKDVPILVIGGPQALGLMDMAAKAGVSDLLQVPYSVDDLAGHVNFLLQGNAEEMAQANIAHQETAAALPAGPEWPPEEESISLTNILLDHYIKHHEVVLLKLKFAQTATRRSIGEIRAVHEKVKGQDRAGIQSFSDFDAMWEDIISLFIEGGLSEDDISGVEALITKMPGEVQEHYSEISQEDRNFLSMVESLNRSAYQRAREKVMKLQKSPSPLNGRTSQDYKAAQPSTGLGRFFTEPSIRDVVG